MSNRLKVRLRSNSISKGQQSYIAEIVKEASMDVPQIMQGLIDDGIVDVDLKLAIEIIAQFNKRTAELVVSGHKVDTGLVRLSPELKGIFYSQTLNPLLNKFEVSLKSSSELVNAIKNTTIDIDSIETVEPLTIEKQANNALNQSSLMSDNDVPACGIAFREWLSK